MPAKNGRGLDEQGCFTPSWRDPRGENNREALPGRPPDAPGNLPLGDDELLSKKRVLGDQFDATANEIRGQSGNESKKVDHGSSLTPSARMTFVARTGDSSSPQLQAESTQHKNFGQPVVSEEQPLTPTQAAARFQIPEYLIRQAWALDRLEHLRVVDSLWLAPSAVAAFARSWRALKGEKPRT